ncbi:aminoglycoside phosphotransferase family protein [Microbacterium sp. p3-SID336]|uniref:aminoglycoside phosphotransferase family protein n=1 Tax=Microbacterium sp. p3-SID336 TaxID=2916212 RepID=UPI0021A59581|nr:aminoglycoside phosphotransferase family protein [Microbacterium sp. p3-SID336]MCT1478414.1 aminoglycoside phosphotransferase family protein [Microbacterium sp. p3-SID336]
MTSHEGPDHTGAGAQEPDRAERLCATAEEFLRAWDLRRDGTARSGEAGMLLPVRAADGERAALKVQAPSPEVDAAVRGLAAWDGRGIVRMLRSEAARGAMLLERLDADRSLESVGEDEAIRVVGGLLARLHSTPPVAGLPRLEAVVQEMLDAADTARVLPAEDRRRVDRWTGAVAELAHDAGERFLHWDLHFGNVLAGTREPWLAIDPEPLVGDAGFDLWPALDSGWSSDPRAVDAAAIVRRRFDLLTDILELERPRAATWTRARLLQNTLWDIEDGKPFIDPAAVVLDDALT